MKSNAPTMEMPKGKTVESPMKNQHSGSNPISTVRDPKKPKGD